MPTFDGESYGLSTFRIQRQRLHCLLGVCERAVERYISKFLVNGDVEPEPVGRSYGSISFAPREQLTVFAYQIWKPQSLRSCNLRSTTAIHRSLRQRFFEISVHVNYERHTLSPQASELHLLLHLGSVLFQTALQSSILAGGVYNSNVFQDTPSLLVGFIHKEEPMK